MASIARAELHAIASASPSRPEDTAVLIRGGRGRGRRMRVISKSKLPRMNNSERGKFYRQKYREYEEQLERDVQRLQSEVHELQRLLELRQLLPQQYPRVALDEVRAATQVVYEGLVRLHERWTSIDQGSESPTAAVVQGSSDEIRSAEWVHTQQRHLPLRSSQSEYFITRHQNISTPMLFKLESVEIQGPSDSRIVVAHGRLYAQYRPADLDVLFPVIRHNKHLAARLLAREVAYSCTYRFHTSTPFDAGDLSFVSVELDAVGGLLATIPNLHCVEALLDPMTHLEHSSGLVAGSPIDSRRSSSSYGCYDSPSASYAHPTPPDFSSSPPRPMALAFILS
ncbi:hypothetical protein PR003_g11966 [Phytophthora rubi]|uniref:BZIP domain-containing protein n=1 Tax=Phytophthora rubi TaxID=129364 RepID=A0A6A3M1K3_9STRA|nr:hypothetical protein PR002_g11479 [Phytophthora rubi]KAE9047755.1 hypothetical protein PR001_g4084 [Phytophthora rubi]KAE9337524.1 hypothetical protein PR003_g11966 [Phytophthora rubi]